MGTDAARQLSFDRCLQCRKGRGRRPVDGAVLVVSASYVTIDGGLYAIIDDELSAQVDPVFSQGVHNDKLGKWGMAIPRPSLRGDQSPMATRM